MELSYTLTFEELIRYHEMLMRGSKHVKKARYFLMGWGPALAALLVLVFKAASSPIWIAVSVLFSLIWIVEIAPLLFRKAVYAIAKRKLRENNVTSSEIQITDEDDRFLVNEEEKHPADYYAYYDLLVIGFDDHSNVVVPQRVFEEDTSKLERFLKDVVRKVGQKEQRVQS